jgi:hypothetical protein
MTTAWRLNIKTGASEGINPRRFCIDRNILGVGWPVDADGEVDWERYYKLGEETYYKRGDKGWWPAVNAIKNRMQINDLCWTRDWDGVYYLGRITSDWKYQGESENRNADVVNIRECLWKEAGEVDAVPGKVVNSFIPNRTVQAVDDESVRLYSQFLYNLLSHEPHYSLANVSADLLSLVSAEDCEDLVGLFLQEKGYRMIASSCKADTAAYEFVLKHAETGKTAVAQVKQGYVNLNVEEYSALPGEVYLFTTHGNYVGTSLASVHCIQPDEIRRFVDTRPHLLSDRLKTWVALIEKLGAPSA